MASASIGAVRVDLGLNSAAFTTGLNAAQGKLRSFGKLAGLSLAGLGVAAAGAATAMGIGIKHALDHADALGKSAQKAGVAVESLSRLEYAAKLSDVSLEQLTGGLQKLGKSMADVASGNGPTAAFQALGIAVKDGLGNLRSGDQVFADVADRFSRMQDGALKTSLAMQIFGKSGAELIPLLNEGRDGLSAMAAESDRLGNTIGSDTARAAEKFNDTLTTIQASLTGVFNRIIGDKGVQGAIQSLADTLASPEFAASMTQFAAIVIKAIDAIAWAAIQAKKVVDALTPGNGMTVRDPGESDADFMTRLGRNPDGTRKLQADGSPMPTGPVLNDFISGSFNTLSGAGTLDSVSSLWAFMGGKGGGTGGGGGENVFTPLATGAQTAAEAIDPLAATLERLGGVMSTTVDPFEQMKLDLTDIQTMFDEGRISAEQFGTGVQKTIAGAVGSFADLAGSALAALSDIFKGNKAIAVASAIVNGIGSVAKTLETYGVTPWGLAAAGVAATTAAANVASILSTSETSTSMPGGSAGSSAAAGPAQQSAINLTVRGSGLISTDDLVSQITQQIADGGHQSLINVLRVA